MSFFSVMPFDAVRKYLMPQKKRSPIHVRRSKSLLCNRAGSWQFSDRERCNITLDNAALPMEVLCHHYGGLSSRNRPP